MVSHCYKIDFMSFDEENSMTMRQKVIFLILVVNLVKFSMYLMLTVAARFNCFVSFGWREGL